MTNNIFLFTILIFLAACNHENSEIPEIPRLDLVLTILPDHQSISGKWTIHGKDLSGKVGEHWTGSLVGSKNNISITAGYERYDITILVNGITREATLLRAELLANPVVTISLQEEEYYVYSTSDGNITVLLPLDPTDPFYEVRVVNPSKIVYCILDRALWKDGKPAHDMLYTVIIGSEVNKTTFADFEKFKGQYGITWDAADSKLVYLSTENKFDEILHEWEF